MATALLLLLAGCVASEAGDSSNAAGPAPLDENAGRIEGVVTDDSYLPLAGATISLSDGALTQSDESGRFLFDRIEPGEYAVTAALDGYLNTTTDVSVVGGQPVVANLVLQPVPAGGVYHVTQQRDGKIFCGMAWRYPPPRPVSNGSGGALAACGVFFGTPLNNTDTFVVPFETRQDVALVRSFVFETQWRATQAFGKGLSIGWEVQQDIVAYTFTEKLRTFVNVRGASPLRGEVNETMIQKNVTENKDTQGRLAKYCQPGAPCKFWARAFPYASTFGPTSPVDFAFYVDQRYTHYATEFYGLPNPSGFTVLVDS